MEDPMIKVTRLADGWGVRCYRPDGTLHSEGHAPAKAEIGPVARELLRWWDKLGGVSRYASRARERML